MVDRHVDELGHLVRGGVGVGVRDRVGVVGVGVGFSGQWSVVSGQWSVVSGKGEGEDEGWHAHRRLTPFKLPVRGLRRRARLVGMRGSV